MNFVLFAVNIQGFKIKWKITFFPRKVASFWIGVYFILFSFYFWKLLSIIFAWSKTTFAQYSALFRITRNKFWAYSSWIRQKKHLLNCSNYCENSKIVQNATFYLKTKHKFYIHEFTEHLKKIFLVNFYS